MALVYHMRGPTDSAASGPIQTRPRNRGRSEGPTSLGHQQSANGPAPAPSLEVGRVGEEDHASDYHAEELTGGTLLLTDLRAGFMLANETRYHALERLFGIRRDQANLVTLVALGMLLQAAHDKADQWLRGPGGPTRADAALGAAVFRELLYGVGGPSSRDTPLFGTLVVVALLGGLSGPALRQSVRGIRTISHRARSSFNRRYGHLIGRHRDDRCRQPAGAHAVPIATAAAREQDRSPYAAATAANGA